jgi:pimeloyl-ACP methyl ester carboxylesterase
MTSATELLGLEPCAVATPAGLVRAYAGGDGPPVVLLHGLSAAAVTWLDVVAGLRARHRVVALDLPGHGGSAGLARGAGVDRYAAAVAAALESLAATPALVAGHSFGGQVALRLALERPDAVRGLLLVASSGVVPLSARTRAFGEITTRLRPGALAAPLALRLAGRAWFRRLAFQPWLASDAASLSPAAARAYFLEMRAHEDVRGAFRALRTDDELPAGTRIACPAIALWGSRDVVVPLERGVELARRLEIELRVVAAAGHLVTAERPDTVLDAVAALAADA